MSTPDEIKKEIEKVKARNVRVEKDKAWETSSTRKMLLLAFTYSSIGLYLNAIHVDRPWLNAIVPAVGFLLSTLTLPYFRRLWEQYIHKG